MSKQIFWSKLEKVSSGDTDAIVPGVTVPGNRRPRRPPKSKGPGRKLQEVKAKIPVKQPVVVENLSPETSTNTLNDISTSLQEITSKPSQRRSDGKPASLKDLCADDKKRVANLIKELAKMGDEKEKVMGQLKEERQSFERQMLQLVEQQEQILREREDIQARYFQCQDLLSRYKDQVLDSEKNDCVQSPLARKGHRKERPRERSLSPEEVIRNDHHVSPRTRSESNKENEEFPDTRINKKLADLENARTSVRRPYTSMIDKEIAQKKHYPDCPSTIVAESGTSTPRMQMGYNDKVPTLKTFREPIMSSTQKSSDIRKELEEFMPLEPDSSPRSTIQDSTPRGRGGSKVGFKERPEFNDEDLQKHSPSLGSSDIVGDRQFMERYKKLNAAERKRELLKQREILLKEQEKLKKILVEQEKALRSKENQLREKQELQRDRLDYLEQNGNLPRYPQTVKSNIGDDGSVFNGKVEKLNLDKHLSEDEFKPLSDDDDDIPYESEEKRRKEQEDIKNYTTKATSPLPRPYHSMATSPIRLEAHTGPTAPTVPSRVDACTSVSRNLETEVDIQWTPTKADDASTGSLYKNQSSPTSPRLADFSGEVQQNNLPFQSNRQRSTDSPTFKGPRTPGDKTLSVVEIVNSLEESPSWRGSPYKSRPSPGRSEVNQGRMRGSPRVAGTAKIFSNTPERGTYGGEVVRDHFDETEAEETAEESEILDDIFFLK